MISFDQFLALNESSRAGAKTGLYPLGYDGIGLYPPAYMLPSSADVLYYMSVDERFASWWEGKPFDISHIPGNPVPHKGHRMPGVLKPMKPSAMPGKPTPHRDHGMAGDERKHRESPLAGKPAQDCLVKKSSVVNPHLAGKPTEKSVCASMFKMPD